MIHTMFPSFYMVEFDESFYEYKNGLIATVNRLRNENDGVEKSNVGGWQSENFHPLYSPQFFKDEFGSKVVKFITDSINKELHPLFTCSISGLWINVNPPLSYNETHVHPGSKLSGAFYVRVPEDSGSFVFVNTAENRNPLNPFLKNQEIFEEMYIKPYDGQLIVFDSHMPHRVVVNDSKQDRISIAFNIDISVDMEKLNGSKE